MQGGLISNNIIESLFLTIKQPKASKSFIVACICKPPSADCGAFTDILCNLTSRCSGSHSEFILCGDFNIDLFVIDSHVPTAEFIHRIYSLSLMLVITKPTRATNHSATLIDNIFVDNSLDYRAGILSSDISDHIPFL